MKSLMVRHLFALTLLLSCTVTVHAQEDRLVGLSDIDLSIDLLDTSALLADSRSGPTSIYNVPNIPDSAFTKPWATANNLHMYLGLASMGLGVITGISAPDGYDPDLLNTVHYKAGKLAWQFGAAAIGTGLWTHWDDFHLEDGILDRDNLHVILGTLGVVGYYLAVKSAVDEYNAAGYPSSDHSSAGSLGGYAMLTAIAITW